MKLIILLFSTLVISSYGQSKERKAVCEAFDTFNKCAQEANIEQINSCSVSGIQDLVSKMSGEQLEVSSSQRQKINSAMVAYEQCVSLSVTEASISSKNTGGFGAITSDRTSTGSEKAAFEKFKSTYKACLSNFVSKAKEIIGCDG